MTSNAESSSASSPPSFIIYEDDEPQDELPNEPPHDLFPHCRPVNPLQELPQPTVTRHKENDLSRDDRVGLQKMKEWTGWGTSKIADTVPFTYRQVQYALESPLTPQKSKKKPSSHRLKQRQLLALHNFIQEDPRHRDISWQDYRTVVPGFVDVGITAIKSGMDALGYIRRQPGKRPRTSPEIRRARVQMSKAILARWPDIDDWINGNIIWSDKKTFYATNQGIRRTTIHQTKDIRLFRRERLKGHSVNHWGSFSGRWKGPNYVFPPNMTNNARTYSVGPLRRANSFLWQLRQLSSCRDIVFMQDNSSVHTSAFVQGWISALGIPLLMWAAWSPDLNPIENLWSLMELWIDDNYDTQNLSVQEQREAISEETLIRLSLSARERFQKCILEEGWPLDY
ncbi:transposable element tc1 transposase [Fusarium albosuccineum]|uniref:Transposable element tc1 transposase n=1 Tax=Fusarium albosuccineum TaxID=1237068 RepID=A0A8H4L487_9HYPO|nr:transposable element tc1 transposase [Fusarium albosuccineum]